MTSWDLLQNGVDLSGAYPSNPEERRKTLSTVFACVAAISSAVASLPCYCYRIAETSRTIDGRHPVSRLMDQPNVNQTWADFVEWLLSSTLLRGNGLAEIVFDNRGAPVELRPIPFENCAIQLLPNRRLAYDVTDISYLSGGTGRPRRLLQHEVFHLRDRSDDGLVGKSRLSRAAAVVQAGLSIQDFALALYRNGANPSGALEVDGILNDMARKRLQESFTQAFSGSSNAARTLILENAIKWRQISVSPEDAEFLASRRFTSEELARLFGVPPVVVGDLTHGTFTNSETLIRWFAQQTLSPWIRKIEAEFSVLFFLRRAAALTSLRLIYPVC